VKPAYVFGISRRVCGQNGAFQPILLRLATGRFRFRNRGRPSFGCEANQVLVWLGVCAPFVAF